MDQYAGRLHAQAPTRYRIKTLYGTLASPLLPHDQVLIEIRLFTDENKNIVTQYEAHIYTIQFTPK